MRRWRAVLRTLWATWGPPVVAVRPRPVGLRGPAVRAIDVGPWGLVWADRGWLWVGTRRWIAGLLAGTVCMVWLYGGVWPAAVWGSMAFMGFSALPRKTVSPVWLPVPSDRQAVLWMVNAYGWAHVTVQPEASIDEVPAPPAAEEIPEARIPQPIRMARVRVRRRTVAVDPRRFGVRLRQHLRPHARIAVQTWRPGLVPRVCDAERLRPRVSGVLDGLDDLYQHEAATWPRNASTL